MFYTSFRFLLDNNNERISQIIFFLISVLYLFYRIIDDYRCFIKKEMIISYLIVIFGVVSVIINHIMDFVSIRAILMLIISFIIIVVDDPNDDNYIKTFEIIVFTILLLCSIHSILCIVFSISDAFKITNFGMLLNGRLKGFTYMSGTGEVALIGLGSNIYLFEKINYDRKNRLFIINLFLLFFNILAVILAQSRCSLYSMAICLISYFALKYNSNNKNIFLTIKRLCVFILIFIICICVIYVVLIQTKIFKPRPFSILSNERLMIWAAYLVVFLKENILFGMGPSRFVYIYRNVLGTNSFQDYINYFNNNDIASFVYKIDNYFADLMPHSEYIRHLVIFGIMGLVCIIFFFTLLFKKLVIMYKNNNEFNQRICYLSIFYVVFPLISGLIENMLSFSNSPRYLECFTIFFITGYIYKFYNEIINSKLL